MRKGMSLILIFAYVAAVFQFTAPYLSYYANFEYFAEEACINRHNPDIECDGKCQLTKMVKNQHDHDESTPDRALHIEKNSSSTIFFWERNNAVNISLKEQLFYRDTHISIYSYLLHNPPTPPPQLG